MTDSSSTSTEDRKSIAIPSGHAVAGELRLPSSKSVSNRYLNLALLCRGESRVERPLGSEDIEHFQQALVRCGCRVEATDLGLSIDARQAGGVQATIDCGASGTMMRLLAGTLTAVEGDWVLDGIARLCERPIAPLVDALRQLGAEIEYLGEPGFPPLAIRGGSLRGGRAVLDASESSQYLSSVLMAAQQASSKVELEVTSLTSEPYVDITLESIEEFGGSLERTEGGGVTRFVVEPGGLSGQQLAVEGDFSAAAYPAAAAALTAGQVELRGLRQNSLQGDRLFLDLIERMGAQVDWVDGRVRISGDGRLGGIDVDLSHIPDQVPTLAALAPFALGETRIRNVAHLRIKESDRLAAMATELGRLGARVEELDDGLVIQGSWAENCPSEAVAVETHGDHRIAMSLALVGLRRPGVTVLDPDVVAKSYPGFWDHLATLLPPGSLR